MAVAGVKIERGCKISRESRYAKRIGKESNACASASSDVKTQV